MLASERSNEPGKPLVVERVVGEKVQVLASHFAVARTAQQPHLELQINPRVRGGQVACSVRGAVVPTRMQFITGIEAGETV